MNKSDLIQKWLNHDLSEEDKIAFKNLEDFSALDRLDRAAQQFKAPSFDSAAQYEALRNKTSEKEGAKLRTLWWSVAAAVVIALGLYATKFGDNAMRYETAINEKEKVTLPDASIVFLLADSKLSYEGDSWSSERELSLEGQANFDVEKGKKFTVNTSQGTVEVLGTNFTVKDFENFFEVTCHEGKVKVTHQGKANILTPGMVFRSINGTTSNLTLSEQEITWSSSHEYFESVPLRYVLEAIERNYGVTISNPEHAEGIFTGKVSYGNLTNALQSITIPFGLTTEIEKDTIILKSE